MQRRFSSLIRHLFLQWGAHAVVDMARECLLRHGSSLMGYMVMVPTLYMAAARMGGVRPSAVRAPAIGNRLLAERGERG